MQDCFREYPEIYAAEIADDEEPTFDSPPSDVSLPKAEAPKTELGEAVAEAVKEKAVELKEEVKPKAEVKPKSEVKTKSETLPNTVHDATAANQGKE